MAQLSAVQQNALNRAMILPGPGKPTVKRLQNIGSQTVTNYVAGQGVTLNFTPAPVGIMTRFLIEVTAAIGIGGAETQTRVQNGAAAFLSNVQYTDTSNQTRINVPGWYLNQLSSMKRRAGLWQGAFTNDINGVAGLGANFTSLLTAAPATLNSAPGANNFAMVYEVPLAYSNDDLSGAVYAALINATQSLAMTVNPNFFVASTDLVNVAEAGYQSSTAVLGKISTFTVNVYQEYIDQTAGMNLPFIDLSTQYLLQTSAGYIPSASSDLVINYANFRRYMSTVVRYNNNGVFANGSDINYFSIRTANGTDLIKVDPTIACLRHREWMGNDLPLGYYAFQHRDKPIYTDQYGNVSFVVQPKTVGGAASSITMAYEMLALTTQVVGAGAVASGG